VWTAVRAHRREQQHRAHQLIDIPHKPRGRSYAKAYVVVRHLLDGRYRVYYGNELVAEATGTPPTEATGEGRSITVAEVKREKARRKRMQG
jgi:hypothetical protein